MTRHTTAIAASRPHNTSHRSISHTKGKQPAPRLKAAQPCILECVYSPEHDKAGQRRETTNGSGICDTCAERIRRQTEKGPKWVRIRRAQVGSWIGGMDRID